MQTANILIVGDEAAVRQCTRGALAAGPFHCTAVAGPAEALEMIQRAPVDVALVNIAPEATRAGVELASRLRDLSQNLPIVLVTTGPCEGVATEAMRIGVIDCLPKPFSSSDLADAITRALEWRTEAVEHDARTKRLQYEMDGRAAALITGAARASIDSPEVLYAWLRTVYRQDVRTFEHVRRVAYLSAALALAMGLEEPELGDIERAAFLHDIGKLAIPEDVMSKQGPLTAMHRVAAAVTSPAEA